MLILCRYSLKELCLGFLLLCTRFIGQGGPICGCGHEYSRTLNRTPVQNTVVRYRVHWASKPNQSSKVGTCIRMERRHRPSKRTEKYSNACPYCCMSLLTIRVKNAYFSSHLCFGVGRDVCQTPISISKLCISSAYCTT